MDRSREDEGYFDEDAEFLNEKVSNYFNNPGQEGKLWWGGELVSRISETPGPES